MKLVIDRTRWLRGDGVSTLLRSGKMCCLGFLAKACGATDAEIIGHGTPREVPTVNWPTGLIDDDDGNTSLTLNLISANDGEDFVEAKREAYIARGMGIIGVKVTFIDGDK